MEIIIYRIIISVLVIFLGLTIFIIKNLYRKYLTLENTLSITFQEFGKAINKWELIDKENITSNMDAYQNVYVKINNLIDNLKVFTK